MNRINTLVKEEHLCIISDLHLGNPTFLQGENLDSFLKYLSNHHSSLCINGDGIDLLQLSIPKLALDIHSILKGLKEYFAYGKKKIYYVIGNHDIYMEAFLEDTGIFNVIPFMDVVSGGRRIHIEHGHLYDSLFINFPRLYIQAAKMLGLLIKISPRLFHFYFRIEEFFSWLKTRIILGLPNPFLEDPVFMRAVKELSERGFDVVIFGHTHHFGIQDIWNNKKYANAGSWTDKIAHYITIDEGEVNLKEWFLPHSI